MDQHINLIINKITTNILDSGLDETSEKYIICTASKFVKSNSLNTTCFSRIIFTVNEILGTNYSTTLISYITDNVIDLLQKSNKYDKITIDNNIDVIINSKSDMIQLYNIPNVEITTMKGILELEILKHL